ncbi:unnamed protein product, partial [Protopolystoma xenopodis]
FVAELSPINVLEGEEIFLTATVQGRPQPADVLWTHNGTALRPENTDAALYYAPETGVCELTISEAFPEDSGLYSVEAHNIYGKAVSQTEVRVGAEKHVVMMREIIVEEEIELLRAGEDDNLLLVEVPVQKETTTAELVTKSVTFADTVSFELYSPTEMVPVTIEERLAYEETEVFKSESLESLEHSEASFTTTDEEFVQLISEEPEEMSIESIPQEIYATLPHEPIILDILVPHDAAQVAETTSLYEEAEKADSPPVALQSSIILVEPKETELLVECQTEETIAEAVVAPDIVETCLASVPTEPSRHTAQLDQTVFIVAELLEVEGVSELRSAGGVPILAPHSEQEGIPEIQIMRPEQMAREITEPVSEEETLMGDFYPTDEEQPKADEVQPLLIATPIIAKKPEQQILEATLVEPTSFVEVIQEVDEITNDTQEVSSPQPIQQVHVSKLEQRTVESEKPQVVPVDLELIPEILETVPEYQALIPSDEGAEKPECGKPVQHAEEGLMGQEMPKIDDLPCMPEDISPETSVLVAESVQKADTTMLVQQTPESRLQIVKDALDEISEVTELVAEGLQLPSEVVDVVVSLSTETKAELIDSSVSAEEAKAEAQEQPTVVVVQLDFAPEETVVAASPPVESKSQPATVASKLEPGISSDHKPLTSVDEAFGPEVIEATEKLTETDVEIAVQQDSPELLEQTSIQAESTPMHEQVSGLDVPTDEEIQTSVVMQKPEARAAPVLPSEEEMPATLEVIESTEMATATSSEMVAVEEHVELEETSRTVQLPTEVAAVDREAAKPSVQESATSELETIGTAHETIEIPDVNLISTTTLAEIAEEPSSHQTTVDVQHQMPPAETATVLPGVDIGGELMAAELKETLLSERLGDLPLDMAKMAPTVVEQMLLAEVSKSKQQLAKLEPTRVETASTPALQVKLEVFVETTGPLEPSEPTESVTLGSSDDGEEAIAGRIASLGPILETISEELSFVQDLHQVSELIEIKHGEILLECQVIELPSFGVQWFKVSLTVSTLYFVSKSPNAFYSSIRFH